MTGLRLPTTLVFDHPSPQAVADFLLERLDAAARLPSRQRPPTPQDSTNRSPWSAWAAATRAESPRPRTCGGSSRRAATPSTRSRPTAAGTSETLYERPTRPAPHLYAQGGFLHEAAEFDAEFFGPARAEAIATDPQQRGAWKVAWEALERAGIDPRRCAAPTGVYAGVILQRLRVARRCAGGLSRDIC